MRNFDTSILNAITDNLRNRYDDGFPILKELIQNADDAEAPRLRFGWHPGQQEADHPLLQGPALWFWNDGKIKPGDVESLCSFGINAKAADAGTIGKFGLGMKSVFHLCEAFFFVAQDGKQIRHECLSPWDRQVHPDWAVETERDWAALERLGAAQASRAPEGSDHWFLLWLPLRLRRHLTHPDGQTTGAIIQRFPGDHPDQDLAFLREPELAARVAEIMPLLHHLTEIEAEGGTEWVKPFAARLSPAEGIERSDHGPAFRGRVELSNGLPALGFCARQRDMSDDAWFAELKRRDDWPPTFVRNALGHEEQAKDEARPEGAVLFARGDDGAQLTLRWAVFLPLPADEQVIPARGSTTHFRLTLHGQFFVDSGRKRVFDWDCLFQPPPALEGTAPDETALRRAWNAALFQRVSAPLVLPTLADFVQSESLSDRECRALTDAMVQTEVYRKAREFLCGDQVWCRCLYETADPQWRRIEGAEQGQLRPLPTPPQGDKARPWSVFPRLRTLGLLAIDAEAPRLGLTPQWQEDELKRLLGEVNGILSDGPRMDYLRAFLDSPSCAAPYVRTDWLQRQLIALLRRALLNSTPTTWGGVREKARRLISLVQPERRHRVDAALPQSVWQGLLRIDQPYLLVPQGLEPPESPSKLEANSATLLPWLAILDRGVAAVTEAETMTLLLNAANGLLKTLAEPERRSFLRVHPELRMVSVRDIRDRCHRAASLRDLERVQAAGTLFSFAGAVGGGQYGFGPLLALALPRATIWLIHADRYRELFDTQDVPSSIAVSAAVLAAVARHPGPLGPVAHRSALLEKANDAGSDKIARRGLRLLLHGRNEHREDDDTDLWVPREDQHSAWAKLWRQWHGDMDWCLLDRSVAGCLPANRWSRAGIKEIAATDLVQALQQGRGIPDAGAFSVEERDEILARVDDREHWQRLPLHSRCPDGQPTALVGQAAYLAPATVCPEDALTCTALIIRRSDNPLQSSKQARLDWLRPLDDHAMIEIALRSDTPADHFALVLDALARLPAEALPHLAPLLRSTAWLATAFDAPIAPENVLDLPADLLDDARRLVAQHRAEHGSCFAIPDELADAVHTHPARARLREHGFSRGLAGLQRLGLLLQGLPNQHIGRWDRSPQPETVDLLADYNALPGWRLLRDAASAFAADQDQIGVWQQLRDGLARPIQPEPLMAVLAWLTSSAADWAARKAAFDEYLRMLAGLEVKPTDWLTRLRLASQAGNWCDPTGLCAGAAGVDPRHLLDLRQARILDDLIHKAEAQPGVPHAQPVPQPDGFRQQLCEAPTVFEHAFAPWRASVEPAMVGVVAGMLGVGLRDAAATWLHPHTFDGLKDQLRPSWQMPGRDSTGRLDWMGERTLDTALDLIETGLVLIEGSTQEQMNLLGDPLRVPLQSTDEIDHLIAGAPAWKRDYEEPFWVQIRLRRIEPHRQTPERLTELLRRTAEYLYAKLYNQRHPDFGGLWQTLEKTRQLDIATARRMILDNIPFYLGQLAISNADLRERLARCDSARQRLAELEAADSGEDVPAWKQARQQQRVALDDLGRAIETRAALRSAVLDGVRSRIRDSQYQPSSIPFELFQNADDAIVELGQIRAHDTADDTAIAEAARRLVVEMRGDRLRILHWGRLLNDRGPTGFPSDERGFGRDLQKMLVLSASDKRPEAGVTGRLGLGFKSVLLVCDRPRIISGRLAVEIVGGLLPKPWKDCADARAALREHGDADAVLPGTLIELAPIDLEARQEVLDRFRRLAGILCVFGSAIRRIDLVADDKPCAPHWMPQTLGDGLELGRLLLAGDDWGTETNALCLRTQHGSLLLALGPNGFRPMPRDIPAVWVTAPTAESAVLGFAINGAFGLDPGRARLAADNAQNLKRARAMGHAAGDALGRLLQQSADDWPRLRERLQLATDLGAHDFWRDVWLGLTSRWLGRQRDAAADLARATVCALIKTLASRPDSIPNGLPAPLGMLTSPSDLRFELEAPLAEPSIVAMLHDWQQFEARFAAKATVTEGIGGILKHLDLACLQPIGPAALLKLCDHAQVEPADAMALGRILQESADRIDWDKGELRDTLNRLRFRAEDNRWADAKRLLTDARPGSDSEVAEERLRFAVAPPERRLHRGYASELGDDARAFFVICRGRMETGDEDIAAWILAADQSRARRIAALRLLARGSRRIEIAALVRDHGSLCGALNETELLDDAGLLEQERAELRRLLASDEKILWALDGEATNTTQDLAGWDLDLATGLERIFEWWSGEGSAQAQAYRERLYPWHIARTPDSESWDLDRSSWLTLFALGVFQSIQWPNDDHNRRFLETCKNRGWWDVFAEVDPLNEPERWMYIIEEYAEAQHGD